MEITRAKLIEYLSGDNIQMTYKSSDSGAGLSSLPSFGYIYPYSALSKSAKKRVDELANTFVKEIEALDENTTPKVYYENTYFFFKERLEFEYVLEQVKQMKSDNKKLASIVVGLQKVLDSDMLQRIQDYKEIK